jgi:outer membrane immunogenic protein
MSEATWTGIYGGLGLGGDAITTQGSGDAIFGTTTLAEDGLGGGDVAGTATLGFDYQMQNWVAGVFGLFDFGGNGNARFAFGFSGFPGGGGGSVSGEASSIDNSWTAGGRIGYLIAPDALVYGLAGYTTTNFHSVTYDLGEIAGTTSASDFHGVTVGGGFEKLITDSLSTRFEYRNTRYDKQIGFSAPGFTNTESQPTVNSVRVLVAYRLSTMK